MATPVEPEIAKRFHEAVDIIKSLPEKGDAAPSQKQKLEYYALYKQSTEGPCTSNEPPFWDMVKKYKWQAWKKLGDMPSQQAMIQYIDKIVAAMKSLPDTPQVQELLARLAPEEATAREQEGPELGLGSPSRMEGPAGTSTPRPGAAAMNGNGNGHLHGPSRLGAAGAAAGGGRAGAANGRRSMAAETTDETADDEGDVSGDEFCDSVQDPSEILSAPAPAPGPARSGFAPSGSALTSAGNTPQAPAGAGGYPQTTAAGIYTQSQMEAELRAVLDRLQEQLTSTTNRVRELEVAAQTGHGTARSVGSGGAGSVRVLGIQIPTLLLWLLWPVVVQFLFRRFSAPPPPPSQPRRK